MLLMLILFFVLSYVKDRRKIFIVVVLLPAIYYLVLKLLGWVANSSYYEESILGYRLREVVQIMSGNFSEASDFTERFERMVRSIKQFLKTPIFGVFESFPTQMPP